MTPDETLEKLKLEYNTGKEALERGEYRSSIEHFENACKLVNRFSRLGGEVQIWLISAYQAGGKTQEAIALCQELATHPYSEIRKQSQDLLFIIQAPRLNRPSDWMTEIPDLTSMEQSEPEYRRGKGTNVYKKPKKSEEEIDLSKVNTKDNQFIWFALAAIILSLISLFLFNS